MCKRIIQCVLFFLCGSQLHAQPVVEVRTNSLEIDLALDRGVLEFVSSERKRSELSLSEGQLESVLDFVDTYHEFRQKLMDEYKVEKLPDKDGVIMINPKNLVRAAHPPQLVSDLKDLEATIENGVVGVLTPEQRDSLYALILSDRYQSAGVIAVLRSVDVPEIAALRDGLTDKELEESFVRSATEYREKISEINEEFQPIFAEYKEKVAEARREFEAKLLGRFGAAGERISQMLLDQVKSE